MGQSEKRPANVSFLSINITTKRYPSQYKNHEYFDVPFMVSLPEKNIPYSRIFSRVQNLAKKPANRNISVLIFEVVNKAIVDFLTHCTAALTSRFTLNVQLPVSQVLSRAS